MPNVEMYGFDGFDRDNQENVKFREDTLWAIIQALKKLGLANDAVVTGIFSFSSYVKYFYDQRGDQDQVLVKRNTPFIRICSTDPEEIQKIIAGLKEAKVGVDIEYLALTGFISAEEMK